MALQSWCGESNVWALHKSCRSNSIPPRWSGVNMKDFTSGRVWCSITNCPVLEGNTLWFGSLLCLPKDRTSAFLAKNYGCWGRYTLEDTSGNGWDSTVSYSSPPPYAQWQWGSHDICVSTRGSVLSSYAILLIFMGQWTLNILSTESQQTHFGVLVFYRWK